MTVYLSHFVVGAIFALSGAYASSYCRHLGHRLTVGTALVAVETAIIVPLVG